jgi:hypothetical protein
MSADSSKIDKDLQMKDLAKDIKRTTLTYAR